MLVILAIWEAEIRRIKVGDQTLSPNQSKMSWRYGSSGRAPALQA
jgi:hypothetical protein